MLAVVSSLRRSCLFFAQLSTLQLSSPSLDDEIMSLSPSQRQQQQQQQRIRGRIRPRPVSFGNPALGTYGGCVYTCEENGGFCSFVPPKGATTAERLVAMTNVPPEQVPEGILNFCRSHRRYIDRVRIVISSPSETISTSSPAKKTAPTLEMPSLESLTLQDDSLQIEGRRNVPPSPSASAMESAASLLAADEEWRARAQSLGESEDGHDQSSDNAENDDKIPSRTYLVLLELSTEKSASTFVQDLNGKPFNSLEPDVRCSVHHVVALQGDDGVSLMSPFFAPASSSPYNMKTSSSPSNKNKNKTMESTTAAVAAQASPGTMAAKQQHDKERTSSNVSNSNNNNNNKTTLSSPIPSHAGEVQNCAVCLERLDLDHTGTSDNGNSSKTASILTTVCNHSFHLECLLQWQDSPCPVCRYDHSGLNEALSQCHVCGTTEHNYVCLICGVVSCGGRATSGVPPESADDSASHSTNDEQHDVSHALSHGHARQHYNETLHAYALDTETQHVWDFVGQGYVHRLLQNAKDDKLVEVADPNNTESYERSLSPGLSDAQEGEVVHRKLEGFASQYYTLLKSQLEQQRIYYEGRLEEIRREYGQGGRGSSRKKATSASAELISALKQERNQLAQRAMTLRKRHDKVTEDVAFLKNMNESLESNKAQMKEKISEAQQEREEATTMIHNLLPPLEDKLSFLMLQLETTTTLESENNVSATRKSFLGGDKKPAARK